MKSALAEPASGENTPLQKFFARCAKKQDDRKQEQDAQEQINALVKTLDTIRNRGLSVVNMLYYSFNISNYGAKDRPFEDRLGSRLTG